MWLELKSSPLASQRTSCGATGRLSPQSDGNRKAQNTECKELFENKKFSRSEAATGTDRLFSPAGSNDA